MLTVNQIAAHFNVGRQTIYKWIKLGMPYTTMVSGRKRFDLEKVMTWIENLEK